MQKLNKPTIAERQGTFNTLTEKEAVLLYSKGHDYTAGKQNEDAYANFRLVAMLLDGCPITPYTIAMVYKLKHLFSLLTFCKTGKQESGEDLEGRHMDERNYTFILNELVPDHLNHFAKGGNAPDPEDCIDKDYYDNSIRLKAYYDNPIHVVDSPAPIHHI